MLIFLAFFLCYFSFFFYISVKHMHFGTRAVCRQGWPGSFLKPFPSPMRSTSSSSVLFNTVTLHNTSSSALLIPSSLKRFINPAVTNWHLEGSKVLWRAQISSETSPQVFLYLGAICQRLHCKLMCFLPVCTSILWEQTNHPDSALPQPIISCILKLLVQI